MRKLITAIFKIVLITAVTLIIIEVIFQLIFLSLPQAIIQRMPQYQERYGIQFNTPHGAREYPANEAVNLEVNQFTGDLYQISCLSPQNAIEIEPYTVTYARDNHGFRNLEPWSDTIDIAVIGDSFTAAESIIRPYWSQLSDSMLVLGLPGSGTLEQALLFEGFIVSRQPQTVILAYFGGNDLTDNLTFADLQQAGITFADKTHQNRNPLDYSVMFHLLLFLRDGTSTTTQSDCIYPIVADTQPPTPLAFFDSMVSLLQIDIEELQAIDTYTQTADAIVDIAQQTNEWGGQFILVYIPQKAEIYWDLLDDNTQQSIIERLPDNPLSDTLGVTESSITAQRRSLESLADEHEFQFLDLTPFLQTIVSEGQSPYFFADTHWNQLGHDTINQILGDILSDSTLD